MLLPVLTSLEEDRLCPTSAEHRKELEIINGFYKLSWFLLIVETLKKALRMSPKMLTPLLGGNWYF